MYLMYKNIGRKNLIQAKILKLLSQKSERIVLASFYNLSQWILSHFMNIKNKEKTLI